MNKEEFDELSEKDKHLKVTKALAWLCVTEAVNPFLKAPSDEIEIIKIILGKVKDGEIGL